MKSGKNSSQATGWKINSKVINELQPYLKYELIHARQGNPTDIFYDLRYIKENYYDKSFMCINLDPGHGMTTVRELALMGRKGKKIMRKGIFGNRKAKATNTPYSAPEAPTIETTYEL